MTKPDEMASFSQFSVVSHMLWMPKTADFHCLSSESSLWGYVSSISGVIFSTGLPLFRTEMKQANQRLSKRKKFHGSVAVVGSLAIFISLLNRTLILKQK